ncbi:MAG: hemerythrin domain-containing protein [Alphaproteobacteria bacterium]|nr:MAG: hemerythrin domain-containing protein [Alphaproteobacteria bacterium]
MAHVLYARRRWLVGAAGLSLVAAAPGWAAPQSPTNKKSAESVPVTATEDLMREHGIVARLMLIYGAGVRRLGQGEDIDPAIFAQAGEIMRDFVHDYHEKNEEEQVFPRFKTAGRMVELITILQAQHGACRKLTERVLELAPKSAVKAEREQLVEAMQATMTLYRPHAAREDTDVFPTLRSLVTPNEFEAIGETLEKSETEKFGADGFEKVAKKVEALEKRLGINDLSQFTPKS